jgi:hypothetical protein
MTGNTLVLFNPDDGEGKLLVEEQNNYSNIRQVL